MNLSRTIFLVTVVAVAAAAVAIAPAGLAATPTPAWSKALEIRSQALDRQCVDPTLSREAFRALCGTVGARYQPTRAELTALELRGQALNRLCDGGSAMSVAGYRAVCGSSARVVTLAAPQAPSPSGFDWGDFGIGAGAMLGLILLTGGIATAVHYGRRGSARPQTAA
jgi:hypothetical protein